MLQTNLTFPNRGELINMIGNALKELTYWAREFRFQYWDVVRYTISSNFIRFSKALEESTKKQSTIQLREADLFLQINVTGTTPNSLVQINCHGGRKALALKKLLEETYPKENYDVMLTTEEFISSFNQPVSSTPVSSSSEKNREESEQGDSEVDKLVDDILKNS